MRSESRFDEILTVIMQFLQLLQLLSKMELGFDIFLLLLLKFHG